MLPLNGVKRLLETQEKNVDTVEPVNVVCITGDFTFFHWNNKGQSQRKSLEPRTAEVTSPMPLFLLSLSSNIWISWEIGITRVTGERRLWMFIGFHWNLSKFTQPPLTHQQPQPVKALRSWVRNQWIYHCWFHDASIIYWSPVRTSSQLAG